MTDKAKQGIQKSSVTIYMETKNGYSSHEVFEGDGHSVKADVALINAVDELHKMLLLSGVEPSVLEYRLHDVIGRVWQATKEQPAVAKADPGHVEAAQGYPGPHAGRTGA